MKIIKNNYVPNYPKKITCTTCKSELEYEEKDITQIEIKDYDPRDNESFTYKAKGLTCPCCKLAIKI